MKAELGVRAYVRYGRADKRPAYQALRANRPPGGNRVIDKFPRCRPGVASEWLKKIQPSPPDTSRETGMSQTKS